MSETKVVVICLQATTISFVFSSLLQMMKSGSKAVILSVLMVFELHHF